LQRVVAGRPRLLSTVTVCLTREGERAALVRAALGPDRFDELFAAGAGLSRQDAVTAARRHHGQGVRAS
jgi:hypothetical protein